jgi:RHS repeat-associated protein
LVLPVFIRLDAPTAGNSGVVQISVREEENVNKCLRKHTLPLAAFVLLASTAFAQSSPTAGNPLFSTEVGGQFDSVDLANSNVLINIPVRQKIGKIPFAASLVGNYGVYIQSLQSGKSWQVNSVANGSGVVTFGLSVPVLSTSLTFASTANECNSQPDTLLNQFAVVDASGTSHPLPTSAKFDILCPSGNVTSAQTTDGSGYTVVFDSVYSEITGLTYYIYDKSGNKTTASTLVPGANLTDPDGATMGYAPNSPMTGQPTITTYDDTLATTAVTATTPWGDPQPTQYSYLDSSGNTQTYGVAYSPYTVLTAFGCSGISEYNSGTILQLPVSISVPGGGSYTIAYEQTPGQSSSYTTGRISKLTLPSGGYISYTYADSAGHHGINCNSAVVPTLTRKVYDNYSNTTTTWTYVNSDNSATPGNYTVTETDPLGDTITHSFSGTYETQRVVADVTLGTLGTTITCFNGHNTSESGCISPSSVPALPITQTDVYTYLGTSSPPSLLETKFDTYGNVTAINKYDFGAAYPPSSSPVSSTGISYGTDNGTSCVAIGNYIYDKPCIVQVSNSTTTLSWSGYTYNAKGHATASSTFASGSDYGHMSYAYNTNGTVASTTETDNNTVTSYAYNGTGGCNAVLPTSVTYAIIGAVNYTWDCNGGVLKTVEDVNQQTTTYTHADPLWRLTETANPDGGISTTAYNTATSPWSISTCSTITSSSACPAGTSSVTSTANLDGLGRTYETQLTSDPGGTDLVVTAYDLLGRVASVTNPYRTTSDPTYGVTSYTYDALGRTTKVTNPDNTYRSSVYTNRATQTTDEVGIVKIYQPDGLGRLATVCDGINANEQANGANPSACGQDISANGFLTTYGYDALNDLTSVNYSGQTRSYSYDGLSRLLSETNPESGTTTYAYDSQMWGDSYQRTRSAPNGGSGSVTTTYTHDALHRLTQTSYSDGTTPTANFQYDMTSGWGGNSLANGVGHLTYAYTGSSTNYKTGTQYSYDPMGRTTYLFECGPLVCDTSGSASIIAYQYNYLGQPTSMQDDDPNRILSYSYNNAGELTTLSSSQAPTPLLWSMAYNALGEISSETRADVGSTTNTYDDRGRLTNHTAGSLYSSSLGYTASSNVASLTDSVNGTWAYGYAAHFAGRLGTATCSANCPAGASPFSYAYDQFGNRWATLAGANQYTFDANNHINDNGVTYDAVGNMIADGLGDSYVYDAESRLTSMNGTSYTASYDALGNRVEQTSAGITNDYIFALNGKILHYNTASSKGLGEDVYRGNEHIGLYSGGTVYMVHHDQVGSTRRWMVYSGTSWSSQDSVTNLPWGDDLTIASGSAVADHDTFADFIQDPDGEFKSETRRYSGIQGRWVTPDPAGMAAVDVTNPQTWNRYAYVTNNPLSLTDPTGLQTCPIPNNQSQALCQGGSYFNAFFISFNSWDPLDLGWEYSKLPPSVAGDADSIVLGNTRDPGETADAQDCNFGTSRPCGGGGGGGGAPSNAPLSPQAQACENKIQGAVNSALNTNSTYLGPTVGPGMNSMGYRNGAYNFNFFGPGVTNPVAGSNGGSGRFPGSGLHIPLPGGADPTIMPWGYNAQAGGSYFTAHYDSANPTDDLVSFFEHIINDVILRRPHGC